MPFLLPRMLFPWLVPSAPVSPQRGLLWPFLLKHVFLLYSSVSTLGLSSQHLSQFVIVYWVFYCVGVCLPHWTVRSEKSSCFLPSSHLPARTCTKQMLSAFLSNEWMWIESLSVPSIGLGDILTAWDQKSRNRSSWQRSRRFLPCVQPYSSSIIPGFLLLNPEATQRHVGASLRMGTVIVP